MIARPSGWCLLKVEAVALIEDDWPGWVRVRLVDATHVPRIFEDKIPIFFRGDGPTSATRFPVPAHICCQVLRTERDANWQEVLVASTAVDGVETVDGVREFRVRPDQVEHPTAD